MREASLFGSRSRTGILLTLSRLESSYPRDLARRLDTPIFAVRKALDSLARDGLVTSRAVGRTRVYTLAPSYPAYKELAALLARLAPPEDGNQETPSTVEPAVAVPAPSPPGPPGSLAPPAALADPGDGWRNW